jgi:hypothetical protein
MLGLETGCMAAQTSPKQNISGIDVLTFIRNFFAPRVSLNPAVVRTDDMDYLVRLHMQQQRTDVQQWYTCRGRRPDSQHPSNQHVQCHKE